MDESWTLKRAGKVEASLIKIVSQAPGVVDPRPASCEDLRDYKVCFGMKDLGPRRFFLAFYPQLHELRGWAGAIWENYPHETADLLKQIFPRCFHYRTAKAHFWVGITEEDLKKAAAKI